MSGAIAIFWILPILLFLGTAALAAAFFLRYRKTVRHAFLTILASGLYFSTYFLMVYDTTLPRPVPGIGVMNGCVILAIYSILAWDLPQSFAYLLNLAPSRRFRACWAAVACLPIGAGIAAILLSLSGAVSWKNIPRTVYATADAAALVPAAAIAAAAFLAGRGAREAAGGARASRIAFALSAALLVPCAFACRYLIFASSFPQAELSAPTVFLGWDLLATAIASFFGPGERQEGAFVSVPDAFIAEAGITAREAEALELLAAGSSYKEICSALGISLPAVKKRISAVYRKSGAANRVELVNILLEYGEKGRGRQE